MTDHEDDTDDTPTPGPWTVKVEGKYVSIIGERYECHKPNCPVEHRRVVAWDIRHADAVAIVEAIRQRDHSMATIDAAIDELPDTGTDGLVESVRQLRARAETTEAALAALREAARSFLGPAPMAHECCDTCDGIGNDAHEKDCERARLDAALAAAPADLATRDARIRAEALDAAADYLADNIVGEPHEHHENGMHATACVTDTITWLRERAAEAKKGGAE